MSQIGVYHHWDSCRSGGVLMIFEQNSTINHRYNGLLLQNLDYYSMGTF